MADRREQKAGQRDTHEGDEGKRAAAVDSLQATIEKVGAERLEPNARATE